MGRTFVPMNGPPDDIGLTMTLDDPTQGVTEVVVSRDALLAGEPLWRGSNQVLDCEYSIFSAALRKSCGYCGEKRPSRLNLAALVKSDSVEVSIGWRDVSVGVSRRPRDLAFCFQLFDSENCKAAHCGFHCWTVCVATRATTRVAARVATLQRRLAVSLYKYVLTTVIRTGQLAFGNHFRSS
jgi:hypothetical protein